MRLVARNCPSAPRRGLATTVGPAPSRLDLSALAANRHAHVRVPVRARAYAYTVYTEAHASRRFVNWEVGALARSTVHFGRNNRRNFLARSLARSLAVRRLAAKVSRSFSIVGGETSGSKGSGSTLGYRTDASTGNTVRPQFRSRKTPGIGECLSRTDPNITRTRKLFATSRKPCFEWSFTYTIG